MNENKRKINKRGNQSEGFAENITRRAKGIKNMEDSSETRKTDSVAPTFYWELQEKRRHN